MLIGLVRHGTHDEVGRVLSGRSEVPLNAAGRAEVTALAERLAGRPVARIETSPRRRTTETARILGDRLGLEPVVVDALDEIDFGAWSGRRFAELDGDPGWDRWNAARAEASTPGGETMREAVARAAAHIGDLGRSGDAHGEAAVLCVTHCDIIRGLVADALGLGLNNILRLSADPASVSWLSTHGHAATHVLTVNGAA